MLTAFSLTPLLAIDIGGVIFFLFLLFSFFGFISKLAKGAQGNRPQIRGGQPRRPGELQNEIDDFLKEVLGQQPAKKPPQRQQVQFPEDDLEVIEEPIFDDEQERRRQESERRKRDQQLRAQHAERERRERERRKQEAERRQREKQKKQKAAPVAFEDQSARPQKTLKDRHIESSVEQHVKTYMAHTVEEQHLGPGTVAPIADAGLPGMEQPAESGSPIARELHALLRSPQGIRQAIMVNEILSKPKGLQSRSA